jgi:hypothetical protein
MQRRASVVLALGFLIACGASAGSSGPSGNPGTGSADSGTSGSTGSTGPGTADDSGTFQQGGSSSGGSSGSSSGGLGNDSDSGSGSVSDGGTTTDPGDGSPGTPPSNGFIPPVQGTCPTIATGTLTFAGQQVQIWAGSAPKAQPGSLVIFWYGTGGSTADATYLFGQAQISAVTAAGGIVAAVSTSNKQGTDTGNGVWYTGDFDTADQVVACALQQKWIDSSRIYTTGDSAGGLQATWMAYARSGYIAAAAPLSGGLAGEDGFYAAPTTSPQDPSNVPSALVTHGAEGVDVVIIDFAVASAAYEADIASKGGFSVDCNTGGGHVSGPPLICPAIWQFFQDHPFKTKDTYSSGLPSSFPSYCKIGPREADGGPT